MKNKFKIALMAAAAIGVSASAQAGNGDLIIGFTGNASDFIYNLGLESTLSQGETWTIGAGLGTQFGVVGSLNAGSHIFATSSDNAENGYGYSTAFYNPDRANIGTITGGLTVGQSRTPLPGDSTSWTFQTAQPAGTPGNILQNNLFDPNVNVGSTAYLFDNSGSGVTPLSFFTYNSSSGVLTYGTAAVPEPSTYGLLGGMGMLALALRRQLMKA